MSFSSFFLDQAGTGLTPYAAGDHTSENLNVFEYPFGDAAAALHYQPDTAVHRRFERSLSSASSNALQTEPGPVASDGRTGRSSKPQVSKRARSSGSASSSSPAVAASDLDAGSPTDDVGSVPSLGGMGTGRRAKFLERNRIAASKCRSKKKEWTNNLEAAARQASQQSRELHQIVARLRDELLVYKTELMQQQQHGCGCGEMERLQSADEAGHAHAHAQARAHTHADNVGRQQAMLQHTGRHPPQQAAALFYADADGVHGHGGGLQQDPMDGLHDGTGYSHYETTYLDGQ